MKNNMYLQDFEKCFYLERCKPLLSTMVEVIIYFRRKDTFEAMFFAKIKIIMTDFKNYFYETCVFELPKEEGQREFQCEI